ncbi:MAG: ribonuclease P protein component [Puniceicoccaceae bacterium]|nr:MAG: ribonuclease P protein component [Puniceicoccaceae bacterium]
MGIPASMRLRKPREFLRVRNLGHRIHCGPFIFQCHMSGSDDTSGAIGPARLGIIASRRVGNAVKRNYGKRLFRELFRRHRADLPAGSELVIVLRRHFDQHSFQDLEKRLVRAIRNLPQRTNDPQAIQ